MTELTIVLPVYNAESTIRRNVSDVLDLASQLTDAFEVLVVDDGSTDDTYDSAREIARRFPQVRVRRHASRRGLGPTLRAVRSQLRSDIVIVHDGVSPIDAEQIRSLWQRRAGNSPSADRWTEPVTINDLRLAAQVHRAMERAHSRLLGFQLLAREEAPAADTAPAAPAALRPNLPPQAGLGAIPPLPRPNLMGSLTSFALGE